MHPTLNIAIRAAQEAGDIIYRYLEHVDNLVVSSKAQNDFVTEVDKQAEVTIINVIRKAFPDHSIKAEESGETEGKESDCQWIIDPLDGTTNFIHGFPQFSVSIALKEKGRLTQAVVYNPVSQELFTATRGEGASLNNRRLRVSKRKSLEGALLGTGFPFRQQEHLDIYLETFRAMFTDTAGIRRPGSAALDLAYVAAGRLDGFWEIGLSEWDMAAGCLLVQEAGGLISDFSGGHEYLESGNIICGNPKVFKQMVQKIVPIVKNSFDK